MEKNKFKQTETCGEQSPKQSEERGRTIGEIPEGWEERSLEEVAIFKNGKSSPNRLDSYSFPVFGSNGIIGYSNEYNSDDRAVIIGRVGSYCGSVYYSANKCWVTDNAIVGNTKEGNDPKFLYYLLLNLQLNQHRSGSGQPLLNQGILNSLMTMVPTYAEQRAIAKILSDLDEKIELNRQMNKTFEAIAQAIFKRWFVDEYKNLTIGKLGDILEVIESGSRPKGGIDHSLKEGIPSIGAENIDGIGFYEYSKSKFISPEFFNIMNRGIVKDYDVLVYKDGAYIGRKSMFGKGFPYEKCCVNEHVFILRSNSRANQFFLYFLLNQDELKQLNTNSAQPGLNQESMRSLGIIIPDKIKVDSFGGVVKPLIDKIFFNCNQTQILSGIRDSLLPKLMSGKIRVL